MTPATMVTLDDLRVLVTRALRAHGAGQDAAATIAGATVRAEAESNAVCGLHYVGVLCEQLSSGRIDGHAEPIVERPAAGVVRVDAAHGFAHVAVARGMPDLIEAARGNGIASMAVRRATNALALSHLVAPLAEAGLVGLAFANAPASMAPPGGRVPVLGTNPLAMAVPGLNGPVIVIDQSATAVTRTAMLMARDRGDPVPEGWVVDADGRPTTDPAQGLAGSMVPSGGTKGFNVALIVEVLAAVLTDAALGGSAAPFSGAEGPPSGTGQLLIALAPAAHGAGDGLRGLVTAIVDQPGCRLPGARGRQRLRMPGGTGSSCRTSC